MLAFQFGNVSVPLQISIHNILVFQDFSSYGRPNYSAILLPSETWQLPQTPPDQRFPIIQGVSSKSFPTKLSIFALLLTSIMTTMLALNQSSLSSSKRLLQAPRTCSFHWSKLSCGMMIADIDGKNFIRFKKNVPQFKLI